MEVAHRVARLVLAQRETRHRHRVAGARHRRQKGPLRGFQHHRDRGRRRGRDRWRDRRGDRRIGRALWGRDRWGDQRRHGPRRRRRRTHQRRGRTCRAARHGRHLVVEKVRARIRHRIRPDDAPKGVVGVGRPHLLRGRGLEFPKAVLLHPPHAIVRSPEMRRRVRQGRVRDPGHLHLMTPNLRLQVPRRWRPGPSHAAGGAGLVHPIAAHPARPAAVVDLPPAPPGLLHHRIGDAGPGGSPVHMGARDDIALVGGQSAQGIGRGHTRVGASFVLVRGRRHLNSTPCCVDHCLRRQGRRAGGLDMHCLDIPTKFFMLAYMGNQGFLAVFPLNPVELVSTAEIVRSYHLFSLDGIATDLAVGEPIRMRSGHDAVITHRFGGVHRDKPQQWQRCGQIRVSHPHTQQFPCPAVEQCLCDVRHIVVVRRQETGEIHSAPDALGYRDFGIDACILLSSFRRTVLASHLTIAGKSLEFHMEMGKIISARVAGTSNDLSLLDDISCRDRKAVQMGVGTSEPQSPCRRGIPLGPGFDSHVFGTTRIRAGICHNPTVHGFHIVADIAQIINARMAGFIAIKTTSGRIVEKV